MRYKIFKVTKKSPRKKPYFNSEHLFMKIMKQKGIRLEPYPQKFCVFDCGRSTTYTPDFLEIGTNRYYEVTNQARCFEQNKRKYESFKELNPELLLINVKPNGETYVHKQPKSRYAYKEKSYYSKKYDEVMPLE